MAPRAIPCPQHHPMVSTDPCVRPRLWRDDLGIMHQISVVVELAMALLELAPYLTEFLDRDQVVLVAFPGDLVDVDPIWLICAATLGESNGTSMATYLPFISTVRAYAVHPSETHC
jgi:hypothetical protein